MKITTDLKKLITTQKELGRAFGVTTQRINQLVKNGTVIRGDDSSGGVLIFESTKNYYSARAVPVDGDDGDVPDINIERAKREKAEREMAELKLAKMHQRIYDAKTVELVLFESNSNLRTQLLGLPSKLAPILEGKSRAEISDLMTKEIEEKLSELADYNPELFSEEVEGDKNEECC